MSRFYPHIIFLDISSLGGKTIPHGGTVCADGRFLARVFYIKVDTDDCAGITQLVEYKLPKLEVAGSIPVARSICFAVRRPDSLFEVVSQS
jgi:hypothetical protein